MAYTTTTGTKYAATKDLDIAAIAVLVRAEIKAAVASGKLPAGKYSAKISRYSMGRSLTVTYDLSGHPGGGFQLHNPVRLAWQMANPHASFGQAPAAAMMRLSPGALAVEATLQGMLDAYNHEVSEPESDYRNTKFFAHVSAESAWSSRRWTIESERIAEAAQDAARLEALAARGHAVAVELFGLEAVNDAAAAPSAQVEWLAAMGAE